MKCATSILLSSIVLISFVLVCLGVVRVRAEVSDSVNATVKISVCGNEVVEGGEDCEGGGVGSQTCIGIGLGEGTLRCDLDCSFDTMNCASPTPTPRPTSTTSPSTTAATPSAPIPTSTPTLVPAPTQSPVLPTVLVLFDPDGDGMLETQEVYTATKTWVEEWRQATLEAIDPGVSSSSWKTARKCDINEDEMCNLQDFSVLMSYVGKR